MSMNTSATLIPAYDDPHEGAWDHLSDPESTCQGCFRAPHDGPCCDCHERSGIRVNPGDDGRKHDMKCPRADGNRRDIER